MARNDTTSAIIDGILKLAVAGTVIPTALVLPNLMIAFDKPFQLFLNKMDKRSQEREIRRVLSYMKTQRLLTIDYKYGLKITKKGGLRLDQSKFDALEITTPKKWDHQWRIVFYDIPEKEKAGRRALIFKLRNLGFYQLQRSVLIHPFPCRHEIEIVTTNYNVARYVSLVEAPFLDNQENLIKLFKKQYLKTKF